MMDLPFAPDQFFDVFATYNEAVWPIQVVAYLAGALATAAALRGGRIADRVISGTLGGLWIWVGVVYHYLHFADVNPSARVFALVFVVQGVAFLVGGVVFHKLSYGFSLRPVALIGAGLIAFAAIGYPLIGLSAGHGYPRAPMFGITPCPLTIFTFGMLLLARGRVPLGLIAIPFFWSIVGGSAAFVLGVPQDLLLPVAGVVGSALLIHRNWFLKRHASRSSESAERVNPADGDSHAGA
jgi:hypothetical protein